MWGLKVFGKLLCCFAGKELQYDLDESPTYGSIREPPTGQELMCLQKGATGSGETPNAMADYAYMTADTMPWEELRRQIEENHVIEEQRAREEREAPDYGTVTMVRNGTRCVLEVYERGGSEPCLFVWECQQAALPRRCDVNAKLVIKSERLGQTISLECVIDRLRNQDVIVTVDDFDRLFVRILDSDEQEHKVMTGTIQILNEYLN
jgi:hypothetical protein